MSYLVTHYQEGRKHWVRLCREEGLHIDHVMSGWLTDGELIAFIAMLRSLDPLTKVERKGVPLPFLKGA